MVFVGFILGIIASYIAWWVNAHFIVPNVSFSPAIARRVLQNKESLYQVAFKNCGRRKMVDIDIMVRVGVEGFMGATGWAYHAIRTNAAKVPDLSSGEKNRRLVRIFDTRDPLAFVDVPSKSIRDAILHCNTLEEILDLGANASIQVHVFGYDSFSGTRKLFSSKKYSKDDIIMGRFNDVTVTAETDSSVYKTEPKVLALGAGEHVG